MQSTRIGRMLYTRTPAVTADEESGCFSVRTPAARSVGMTIRARRSVTKGMRNDADAVGGEENHQRRAPSRLTPVAPSVVNRSRRGR